MLMSNQTKILSSFSTLGSITSFSPVTLDYYQLFISQSDDHAVVFEEELVLMDGSGQHLDEVTVAVEKGGEDSFMVYQYSQDESRLLRVQSRVYRNLETATELRRIRQQDQIKTLRVTDSALEYKVFLLCVSGKEGWREKLEYTKTLSDLMFLEGCNVLLLRKLAVSQLLGHFKGQTINHVGDLCECEYHVERGNEDEVVVRRVVMSAEEEVMTTVLSKEGRILMHQWSSSDWYLVTGKPKNKAEGRNSSSLEEEQVESEQEIEVDKDVYFEKKEELIQLMNLYLQDQPDVQDMIADFLKNLLFEKPDDVVDFADQFFTEFLGIERPQEFTVNDSNSTSNDSTVESASSSSRQDEKNV